MAHLKEIIDRIQLITSTQQLTQAMKMISIAKLHKMQQLLMPFKEYTAQYTLLFNAVLQGIEQSALSHPLVQNIHLNNPPPTRLLLVVLTSDRGLCGAFNKNIYKAVRDHIHTFSPPTAHSFQPELLVIGKKSFHFLKKTGIPIINHYIDLFDALSVEKITQLTNFCIDYFQSAPHTRVILIHTSFINPAKQSVSITNLLPYQSPDTDTTTMPRTYYIYEPSQATLLDGLIPEILKNTITTALYESCASEHATRISTMSQATHNAEELLKNLRMKHNRLRQALITNALAEITSGREALSNQ